MLNWLTNIFADKQSIPYLTLEEHDLYQENEEDEEEFLDEMLLLEDESDEDELLHKGIQINPPK